MQISPHTETAQIDYAPMSGVEPPYKPETEPDEESGAFAKILAELLQKTGTVDDAAAEDAAALEGVSLAALTDAVDQNEAAGGVLSLAGREKTGRAGKSRPDADAAATDEAARADFEFSEDEQNIPFGVELLLHRTGEQAVPAGEDGENAADDFSVTENSLTGTEWDFLADLDQALEDGADFAVEAAGLEIAGENPLIEPEPGAEKKQAGRFAKEAPGPDLAAALKGAQTGMENKLVEQTRLNKTGTGEKEGRNRLEEARGRRRGAAVEVRDFRGAESRAEHALQGDSLHRTAAADGRQTAEGGNREITLELHLPNQGNPAQAAESAANANWETKAGQAFEDLLARELHQNFNNDIVRHASMALRDNGEGTIRLALKPETLGNVKIRLEMAENKITGHIVVESEEALRAFEREIHSLEQAFKDSGFDGANLQMSLAADGRGADQFRREGEASQFLPERIASRYDAAIERAETPLVVDVYQRGTAAINVLA